MDGFRNRMTGRKARKSVHLIRESMCQILEEFGEEDATRDEVTFALLNDLSCKFDKTFNSCQNFPNSRNIKEKNAWEEQETKHETLHEQGRTEKYQVEDVFKKQEQTMTTQKCCTDLGSESTNALCKLLVFGFVKEFEHSTPDRRSTTVAEELKFLIVKYYFVEKRAFYVQINNDGTNSFVSKGVAFVFNIVQRNMHNNDCVQCFITKREPYKWYAAFFFDTV